ncbi:MAG: STAS domain-containing protein [Desulfovibrionaceae bacterium]
MSGRMDAVTAPDFEKGFTEYMDAGGKKFVLDLSRLEYISSAGLRGILSSAKKLKAGGGKIAFAGLGGMVKEVFDISGFGSMFDIYATVEEAVSRL